MSHKSTLQRWWAITLLAIIFLSTFWVVMSMTVYFAQENGVTTRLYDMSAALRGFSPARLGAPVALRVGEVSVIRRDSTHGDVIGWLTNQNAQWGATTVRYHFTIGATNTPSVTVSVNPGETRPIMALNQSWTESATVTAVVESVAWARGAPPVGVGTFTTQSVTWEPTRVTIGGKQIDTVSVHATLLNTSVYNYYRVAVPVVVRSHESIVAIDDLSIDQWPSRTIKTIAVTWPFPVTGVSDVTLTPTLNQYDAANRY